MADQWNEQGQEQEEQQEAPSNAATYAPVNNTGGMDYSVDFIWGSDQDQYMNPEEA
ncbi:hypothetical protein [Paenibacillus methanolicus]|uniref:Uncharacterized protein n=1 Tax=Paenibacillus methanolicus TaxID=582686 RepID=A0A5S5CLZ2_9BACL|nr:hypothetical protein [Paenibacillus methanolicus]TYP79521.1 hypothetical protein BCM02_101639 [Paenibacillus methanolicus]